MMDTFKSLTKFVADAKISVSGTGIPAVDANKVLANGLNLVYFLAGIICIIVIVVGAITYTSGGGNPDSVTRAKNMILYSLIGLVIVFMAFGLTWFIVGRLT